MANSTLEVLESISMQLRDITDQLGKSNKDSGKSSSPSSGGGISSLFSGKSLFNLGKDGGQNLVKTGEGLSSLGKGLFEIKKVGSAKKVERYLEVVQSFIETVSKIGSPNVVKASTEMNKSVEAITKSMTELFKVITLKRVMTLWMASQMLSPKMGERIGNFYFGLVKGLKDATALADPKMIQALATLTDAISGFIIKMTLMLAGLTLLAAISTTGNIVAGLTMLGVVIAMTVGMIWGLYNVFKLDDDKGLGKNGADAINAMSKCVRGLVISLGLMIVVAAMSRLIDFGDLMMVGVMILGMIGTLLIIKSIVQEHGESMLKGVASVVLMIGALTLVLFALKYLVSDEEDLLAILGGMVMLGLIVGMAIGVIMALNKYDKDITQATESLLKVVGIFALIAVMARFLIAPLADEWASIAVGTVIVLGLLVVISTVAAILGSEWFNDLVENAEQGMKAIAMVTLLMLGVAVSFKLISLLFNNDYEQLLLSAGIAIVLATVTGVLALGLIELSEKIGDDGGKKLALGGLAVVGTALIILAVGWIFTQLIPVFQKVEEYGVWKFLGGLVITTVVMGLMGLILTGLAKLIENNKDWAKNLGIGVLIFVGISLVFLAMEQGIKASVRMLEAINAYASKTEGGWWGYLANMGFVVLLMTAFGAILLGIGALASNPVIALALGAGAATFIGISLVFLAMEQGIKASVRMLLALDEYDNTSDYSTYRKKLESVVNVIGGIALIMTGIGVITAFGLPFFAAASVALIAAAKVVTIIGNIIIKGIISTLKEIDSSGYTVQQIKDKAKVMPEILIGFIEPFMNWKSLLSLGALKVASGPLIAAANAVKSIGSMYNLLFSAFREFTKFLDELGMKPEDLLRKDNAYTAICDNLATGFTTFLSGVSKALSDSKESMDNISATMLLKLYPVMMLISRFIDIVQKVATMQIITGYDENGKPEFERLPPNVFQTSAIAIAKGFIWFMEAIKIEFNNMSDKTIDAMNSISRSIKPIMEGVSTFVDAIIKMATARYIEDWEVIKDASGGTTLKPVYGDIPNMGPKDTWAASAGYIIGQTFGDFVDILAQQAKDLSEGSGLFGWGGTNAALKNLSKSIKPIMDSVSSFVDAIIKMATATIITGYDENGKPQYEKLEQDWALNAGIAIVFSFSVFLLSFANAAAKLSDTSKKAVETLSKSMSPLMDSVGSFVNALINMGQNQYEITGYDDNGKPIFNKNKKLDWNQLGTDLANNFVHFLTSFIDEITANEEKITNSKDLVARFSKSVKPVMEALDSYTKSIKNLFQQIGWTQTENGLQGGEYMFKRLKEATEAARDALFSLFTGPNALSSQNLISWGMDRSETTEMYNRFKKSLSAIKEGIKVLVEMKNLVQSGDESGAAELKNVMGVLAESVEVWMKDEYPDAVLEMYAWTPIMVNGFNTIFDVFKRMEEENLRFVESMNGFERSVIIALSSTIHMFNRTGDSMTILVRKTDELGTKLDDVIIKQNDKRIDAINELKKSFDKVTESVDKVRDSMIKVSLQDFTTLRNNVEMVAESFLKVTYGAMRSAINGITGSDSSNAGTADTKANNNARSSDKEPTNNTTVYNQTPVQFPRNITVYFGTKSQTGRIEWG